MAKFKSKAGSKLKNMKAVKEMLAGTHRTQTNKTYGYTTSKETKKREVGESWIEKGPNGVEYKITQKDGFRVKTAANSILDEVNKIISMPEKCPNCGQSMYGEEQRLNKKFWKSHKTCFDCVVKMETQLRAEGKYEEYERKKMHENAKSWFNDVDKEVEILKLGLEGSLQYVQNKDGDLEEYDQTEYREKYLKYVSEQYERFKKETLDEFNKDKK